MPTRPQKPDQRHLRRAADAAAGRDANQDLWVAVELAHTAPFQAIVFEEEAPGRAAVDVLSKGGRWKWELIPCRAERHAFRRNEIHDSVYLIIHEWWSPLVVWNKAHKVRRKDVKRWVLMGLDGADKELFTVDLNAELEASVPHAEQKKDLSPDAIFFSFEALDKFLFPQLVATYGVTGAWQMRNSIRRQLSDEVISDLAEQAEDENISFTPE